MRRKLAPSPPWLLAIRAVGVLATCGAVWFSVRGQHPYRGPTAAVIPVLVVFTAVAGVSFRWYPTTVMVVPGLAWAAIMATRAGRRGCATGLAVVVGVVGAFAGSAGSWAVAGVGRP